jgi:hypothetical protein
MNNFWAGRAKRALAECLFARLQQQPQQQQQSAEELVASSANSLRLSVEAVGSGVVIVPLLTVDRDSTLGELKELLLKRINGTDSSTSDGGGGGGGSGASITVPSAPAVRLFVGHGGAELRGYKRSLRECAVPDGATLVLVVVDERKALALIWASFGATVRNKETKLDVPPELVLDLPLSSWDSVTCNAGGSVVGFELSRYNISKECACVRACARASVARVVCLPFRQK